MNLYEAVSLIINRREYGDENAITPSKLFIDDYVDRLTHSEFLIILSQALEKMKQNAS